MFDLIPAGAELVTLLFLVLPGSVFLWAYERLSGPVGVRGSDRLLRAIAFSVILLAALGPWLVRLVAPQLTVPTCPRGSCGRQGWS